MLCKLHSFFSCSLFFWLRWFVFNRALSLCNGRIVIWLDILREFLYHFLLIPCFLPVLTPNVGSQSSKLGSSSHLLLDSIKVFLSVWLIVSRTDYRLASCRCSVKRSPRLTLNLPPLVFRVSFIITLLISLLITLVRFEVVSLRYMSHTLGYLLSCIGMGVLRHWNLTFITLSWWTFILIQLSCFGRISWLLLS